MNILITSVITFLLWLFLKTILIPRVKQASFSDSKFAELSKIGWLAALGYIRKLLFITSITYLVLWVVLKGLLLFTLKSESSARFTGRVFSFFNGIQQTLSSVDSGKFYFILTILALVFIILIVKNARKFGQSVYLELYKQDQNGALSPELPSEKMNELAKHIAMAEENFEHLVSQNIPKLTLKEKEEREGELEYLNTIIWALKHQLKEENIRRRIIPSIEKLGQEDDSKLSKKNIFNFFISKGFINSLYKTSRTLSAIGIAFIMMSFIVASKNIIQNDTTDVVVQIAELKLQKERQELDQEWYTTLEVNQESPEEASDPWTEEDEEIVDQISRSYELKIAKALTQSIQASSRVDQFAAKANAVKEKIIKVYATSPDGTIKRGYSVRQQGAYNTNIDAKTNYAKKYSRHYVENVNSKKPQTAYGKQLRDELKVELKTNPKLKNLLKTKVKANSSLFFKTATPREVLGMVMGESLGALVDQSFSFNSSGTIASDIAEMLGTKAGKSWLKKQGAQFRNDLVSKTVQEALDNTSQSFGAVDDFFHSQISKVEFPTVANTTEIVGRMAEFQPALDFEALSKENIGTSRRAVKELAQLGPEVNLNVIEGLADFAEYFPSQTGANQSTEVAKLSDELLTNASSISNFPRETGRSSISASRRSAGRARSFKSLRGFRRVGGVLIGREASNSGNSKANFTNISWKKRGKQMEILLHRADGKILSAGLYDNDIVHQALIYAADGRPIAITMVQGTPMPFLKILVHPTLVDTDLGCKAIGLDRLVDTYATSKANQKIEKAMTQYSYQDILYKYASRYVIINQYPQATSQLESALLELKSFIFQNWQSIYTLLDKGEVLNNKELSPLRFQPKYFDSDVLDAISNSLLKSQGSFSRFDKLIQEIELDKEPEDLISCQTELWSGVRELPFTVDNDLSFLRPQKNQNSRFFPLSFIRQVTYSPLTEGEPETIDPWGFPSLKKEAIIEKTIWEGIQSEPKDLVLLERMKSFTRLQRVFRVTLSGDLGFNFPTEKLAELAEQTKHFPISKETPTWNSGGRTWDTLKQEMGGVEINDNILLNMERFWNSQEIGASKNLNPCN